MQHQSSNAPALSLTVQQRLRAAGISAEQLQNALSAMRGAPKPTGPGALQRAPAASPLATPLVTPGMEQRDGSIPQQAIPSDPMAGTFGDPNMMPPGGARETSIIDDIIQRVLSDAKTHQPIGRTPEQMWGPQSQPGTTPNPGTILPPGGSRPAGTGIGPGPAPAHPGGTGGFAQALGAPAPTGPSGGALPQPPLPQNLPTPGQGGENDWAQNLLQFGLQTMVAGERPGASLLGSLGQGGMAAMADSDRRKRRKAKDQEIANVVTDSTGKVWGLTKTGKKVDLGITATAKGNYTKPQAMEAARKVATTKTSDQLGGETTQFDAAIYSKMMTALGYPELGINGGAGAQQYKEGDTATNLQNGEKLIYKGGQWVKA